MKQFTKTLMTMASILPMAMVLIATPSGAAETASSPNAASHTSQPAVTESLRLVQAETAFGTGHYGEAAAALRQLLVRGTDTSFAWDRYNRAVLATAGDAYLQAVPANRLRINMADFVGNLKTGSVNYFLLDVREPLEFARGNVPGSENIPFRDVFNHLNALPRPESGKQLIIICQTQHRANHVLVTLREAGFSNAFTLRGGYSAYVSYQHRLQIGTSSETAGPTSAITQKNVYATTGAESPPENVAVKPVNSAAAMALKRHSFELAVEILQKVLKKNGTDTALWNQYDQALLALAGARYLCTVPDSRYRVDIEDFVTQYRTHARRFFLVDVRNPDEFAKGHIKGSVNIPFRTLMQHLNELPQKDSSKTLLIICRSQHRAIHNLVILRELGYTNAFTLHGGYTAFTRWLKKLPTISNTSSIIPGTNQPEDIDEEEEDFGC